MTALRIAVAGAGLIGRRHIDLVRAAEGCELAAVADPAPAARSAASTLGVPWYASIPDLLAEDRPDGIVVATPSPLHLEHGLACLDAGVPTLLEKPIATIVEDGVRLAEAADRCGVPLLVGHHRRHGPILRAARRVMDEGRLGRLVAVNGAAVFRKPDGYFEEAPWRRQPGGGPLLINLVHEMDSLRFLCGEVEAVQAMASSAARGFTVEDTVAITLAFADGALGTFLLSDAAAAATSWELTAGENAAYPRVPGVDCYTLAGDAGSLGVPTMRLTTYPAERSWWAPMRHETVQVEPGDPLEEQLRHFCRVIRGEAAPLVTGWDGAQDLLVVTAIAEAARTQGTVRTPVLSEAAPPAP